MSNYSDFFGVGSSGGGGSVPINSYLPFLVSATGNPTGYDATTGLYTHPDGTFWLETGNTIFDSANTYPSATGVSGFIVNYTGVTFNENVTMQNRCATYNGDNVAGTYLTTNGTNNDVYSFTYTGGVGTVLFNAAGFVQARAACFDGTNYFVLDLFGTLNEYDSAGIATGRSITVPGGSAGSGLQIDSTGTIHAGMVQGGASQIYRYDKATLTLQSTLNFGGNNFDDFHYDEANSVYWMSNAGSGAGGAGVVREIDNAGADTGRSFNTSAETGTASPQMLFYDGTNWYRSNSALTGVAFYEYGGGTGNTVGDNTARTDTDTSQPLFIRLK